MKELSLFSGAGGGILGSKLAGHTIIGAVEINEHCQKVLRQRQDDGVLERFPIYGDIRAFIRTGRCELFRGLADIISAGFPCQPFSVAGKHLGADDPRNMWPETIECIRRVRPQYALLENVPGLLAHEYFRTILGELAEAGYDAECDIVSACEVGAPHTRERLFILAYSTSISGRRECGRLWSAEDRSKERNLYSWENESRIERMADGVSDRLDRT